MLKQISPNAKEINKGEVEAKNQMGLVGGVLPVQSWDSAASNSHTAASCDDEMCSITDIDDEM